MSNEIDAVLQQMAELTSAVKAKHEAGEDPKTALRWDDVQEKFGEQIKSLVSEQIKAQEDARPARRIAGEHITADGETKTIEQMKDNRYFKELKDFHHEGKTRRWNKTMKPFDLWLAKFIMEGQYIHQHAQINGKAYQPSNDLQAAVKALTSTGTGTGDELVPTEMAAMLWDDFFLASRIVGTMDIIPMPTNPFDVPLGLGSVTWRKGTQNTATTASDPATAKSTLTATELVTEQNWSYTLDEDAVVAMAPAIRGRLAQSGAEIIDDFALNADATNAATGNINLDDADPADDKYYLSDGQDGIRHQWLVDNTSMGINAGGDALSDDDITDALALMGKYAVNPSSTVMTVDTSTYLNGLLKLDTVITVDKFGPDAVVRTGQLAAYRGIPVVVSASAPLTEADGKLSTTGSNNTLGQISIYNTMMWYAGFRRELMIEIDRDIQKRQYIMVTSLREAVASHGTRSSNTHTAGIRNILV